MLKRIMMAATIGFMAAGATIVPAQRNLDDWAAAASNLYQIYHDQQYGFASGVPLELDVWQAQAKESVPTVIYYHGGGWMSGNRTDAVRYMLPWIVRGWNVIDVEYRLSGTALAPAAVEDARCALRWVYRNAKQFRLDTDRIIVTGDSAGGHLALMTGMLRDSHGFDNECPINPSIDEKPLKVAAIVDWYGPTDLNELIEGPKQSFYAVAWFGSEIDREAQARRVSPLNYIRPGLPPVFIVHGNEDPIVPYTESVRLHEGLDRAHVPNQLYTVQGGKHGQFGVENNIAIYRAMWNFLETNVPLLPQPAAAASAQP